MTTEQAQKIIELAFQLAASGPKAQARYAYGAKVRWDTLHDLRLALLDAGLGARQGWKFPVRRGDVAAGWHPADHEDVWDQSGPGMPQKRPCYGGEEGAGCKVEPQWRGPSGELACDGHVPKRTEEG
jgi:hypothetical protein